MQTTLLGLGWNLGLEIDTQMFNQLSQRGIPLSNSGERTTLE